MSATERKEKIENLRIENNELRQTTYSLTKMNAELLERADDLDQKLFASNKALDQLTKGQSEMEAKLDRLDGLLESISLWMYKQQGTPLPPWEDEFREVCQMMEPKLND